MTDYRRDGYVVVPDVLNVDQISTVFEAVAAQARKYRPKEPAFGGDTPWRSSAFDAALMQLRAEEPATFSRIYDTLQTNAVVMGLALSPSVSKAAARALNEKVPALSASGIMLRVDVPGDSRNKLDWHQERSYYRQNENGDNGIVVWIALRDVDETSGAMLVCPGSHERGFISVASGAGSNLSSEQFRIPESEVQSYRPIPVRVKAGAGVFFHMHLFHASGTNRTNRVRFTLGVRYHRATTDDFKPGRLQYVVSGTKA